VCCGQGDLHDGLVISGDAQLCRAALINDNRAWTNDPSLWGDLSRTCPRHGQPSCNCAK
jgi:hypothetical protein